MCGITGYKGKNGKNAELVFNGLKKLEYRGYDSWGVATPTSSGIKVHKKVGKIGSMNLPEMPKSDLAIAHTRWATHGGVTENNAHPHLSCDSKIAVVHNGIIENYTEIKNRLVGKGHAFASQTDTEVIPHLIEDYMNSGLDFKTSVMSALKHLEGSYAIVAICSDSEELIAARKHSPLVLGVGKGEYFVASDIPAFLEHTKNIVYLHDDDFVIIKNGGFEIYNLAQDAKVNRPIDTIEWSMEQAMKGDFEHFTLKEITEQAETIKRALMQDPNRFATIAELINNSKEFFLVGCGTAHHASLAGSYFFSRIANKHASVIPAYEFSNVEHFVGPHSLVIAVSQSGETADTLEAVRKAKSRGAKTVAITNVVGSSLTRESDNVILMNAGPEISVVATKSYTSQLAILLLLAYAASGKYAEGREELEFVWNEMFHLTARSTRDHIKRLSDRLQFCQHLFTIGRGLNFPTALEAALKIKEISYIHAEGFAGGGLKHGPLALIDNGTPCMVFVGNENAAETLSNAQEIKARGGYIIGVSPVKHEVFDFFIKVPDAGNANPIIQAVPAQILAYQLAVLRGCDPDKPRNLAKSVTVK